MRLLGSREFEKMPHLQVKWVRGRDNLTFNHPKCSLTMGKRGSGKSNLLEVIGCGYHPKIIDLMGSRDNENLVWCRPMSPVDDILLITGPNVDLVGSSWDVKRVDQLTLDDILSHEVTATADSFYSSQVSRFDGINRITELFWERLAWSQPVDVVIREASNYIYSRIVNQKLNIKEAKADFMVFQREMRHFGFSLDVDTVRWTSIDKEMRDLADLLFIKKVGAQGLPDDLKFMYKLFNPLSVARMSAERFIVLTDNASIGVGRSDLAPFHKPEGLDIMAEVGLRTAVGDEPVILPANQVQPAQHSQMVELVDKGETFRETAKRAGVSSTDTVGRHLREHNEDIQTQGVCPRCQTVNSPLMATVVRPKVRPGPGGKAEARAKAQAMDAVAYGIQSEEDLRALGRGAVAVETAKALGLAMDDLLKATGG